ncbi:MAG: CBM35 domain-containing protein [Anaerocolumna sp.]
MNVINSKRFHTGLSLLLIIAMVFNMNISSAIHVLAANNSKSIYEAETATLYNVNTNTDHTDYSGTGFVDSYGESGDYVSFNISVDTEQDYTLRFRYANYTGSTTIREVYVDGTFISNAYFADSGSWDVWDTTDVGTTLTAGTHTVKVSVDNSSDGYINLDNLTVTDQPESVRSLYMSNWKDSMAIWMAGKLCNNDSTSTYGPRIAELRSSDDWTINQIIDYSGFFRDETNSVKYDQIHNFNAEAYYDEDGTLNTNYLEYDEESIPDMDISKDYVMVPNKDFMVARYTLTNTGNTDLNYSILDMLHVNNTTSDSISASYDSQRKALIVNRSNSSLPYLALGAFAAPSYYQVANDGDSSLSSSTCSPWYTYDNDGTLKNNSSMSASDISLAFTQDVIVSAGTSSYVYFYIAMDSSLLGLQNLCDEANAQTGSYWFDYTKDTYENWFDGVTIPAFTDSEMLSTYKNNLVMVKNAIRPGTSDADGAMPATTNPYNYGYKVWARDSAVTALALDGAGLTEEAETYWNWLAARQASNGTFETCYYLWDNADANFVEPEYDSLGFFLIGVYKHYMITGDTDFLTNIYSEIKNTANYIMNNMDQTTGFGPADYSIWEEGSSTEYYTYTQAAYAMGLKCAAMIAAIEGDDSLCDSYNGAGSTILTAISRDTTAGGLWDDTNKYYARSESTSGTLNSLVDSSTDILFVLGTVDAVSSRASNHIAKVESSVASDIYGLARYAGDIFYYTSQWSPGGNEALEASPSWPQMTMWDSVYQSLTGNTTKAYQMLEWFKDRTAAGYMVTGEAVSDVTEQPLVSTAAEPVTAASYILASLVYYGLYDTRVYSSENNAGCYTSIAVTSGADNDWGQYTYVPYYLDEVGDTAVADSDTDIAKVYISNDTDNIYIRVNNASGSLSDSTSQDAFQISVYTEDFSSLAATSTETVNGTELGRDMAYMFTKKNTDTAYSKYAVTNGSWALDKEITSVISPQWDSETGGFEIVIPRSEIGSPANDAWGHITVVMQTYEDGTYIDQDIHNINYNLRSSSDSWYYGNFE